ncbi:Cadherin domain-containing protein [Caenorhabditis elegans]|uniref:Cadherin domain-containing protein n=1 Tax=Caenorhabditis elegans TaxID=6239 RepID=F5GU84_CAEEL|nr:Cadherin domain-containing protein [Caenorhabditis elegans]CCA65612.1 Cadherin domain-containing protein [Caenorhabditis elegans]|eukprot:NP_001257181.1 Uncharacterized protein CELE_T08D10.5 [Caenorhabditis elegans]
MIIVVTVLKFFFLSSHAMSYNSASSSNIITKPINTSFALYDTGFPLTHFEVTMDNNTTFFILRDNSGIVYQITLDYIYRELASIGDNEIFLIVNVSHSGVDLLLTTCDDEKIGLRRNVVFHEFKLSKSSPQLSEECINLQVISSDEPVNGQISVQIKPIQRRTHLNIILAVTFSFVMCMLLIRQCAKQILLIVYDYDSMEEFEA